MEKRNTKKNINKPQRNAIHHEVYKTICDTCKKPCEVPFKPNGKKPVFCDACFGQTRTSSTPAYAYKKDRPVFETPDNYVAPVNPGSSPVSLQSTDIKIAELKRELSSANAKLDKLIDLFNKLKVK
jgi:CxxC-x17-CxxC domain-containing protein